MLEYSGGEKEGFMENQEGISRRRFVQIGSGAAAAAVLAGLAGCGNSGASSAASASSSASSAASSSSSSSSSSSATATQTITDLKGDSVTVPTEINKIADLWHAHNQIVLMLGSRNDDRAVFLIYAGTQLRTIRNTCFFAKIAGDRYLGQNQVITGTTVSAFLAGSTGQRKVADKLRGNLVQVLRGFD